MKWIIYFFYVFEKIIIFGCGSILWLAQYESTVALSLTYFVMGALYGISTVVAFMGGVLLLSCMVFDKHARQPSNLFALASAALSGSLCLWAGTAIGAALIAAALCWGISLATYMYSAQAVQAGYQWYQAVRLWVQQWLLAFCQRRVESTLCCPQCQYTGPMERQSTHIYTLGTVEIQRAA